MILAYQEKHKKFDAKATGPAIAPKTPLVELTLELVDRNGRMFSVKGLVKNGSDSWAAADVVKENGGIVVTEGRYLKMISFPSKGFDIEFPQFYLKDGLAFKIKDGKVVWSCLEDAKIKGDTKMRIQDDRPYTQDMPDISSPIQRFFFKSKKGGGGCGGSKEEEEILSSEAMKLAERDPDAEFSYNPKTGDINPLTPLVIEKHDYIQDPFEGRPDSPGGSGAMGLMNILPFTQKITEPEEVKARNGNIVDASDKNCKIFVSHGKLSNLPCNKENCSEGVQREVYKRENILSDDYVNSVYLGYSKSFLSRMATTEQSLILRPDNKTHPLAFDGFQKTHVPEESMIMRLLMNPVERRLWGKLYGLPDDEQKDEPRETSGKRTNGKKVVPEWHDGNWPRVIGKNSYPEHKHMPALEALKEKNGRNDGAPGKIRTTMHFPISEEKRHAPGLGEHLDRSSDVNDSKIKNRKERPAETFIGAKRKNPAKQPRFTERFKSADTRRRSEARIGKTEKPKKPWTETQTKKKEYAQSKKAPESKPAKESETRTSTQDKKCDHVKMNARTNKRNPQPDAAIGKTGVLKTKKRTENLKIADKEEKLVSGNWKHETGNPRNRTQDQGHKTQDSRHNAPGPRRTIHPYFHSQLLGILPTSRTATARSSSGKRAAR